MGIKKFNTYIIDKYSKILISKRPFYDHIYVDINYILHKITTNQNNLTDVLIKLFGYLDNIFMNSIPCKSVTFCTDGAAPFSKLVVQRKRRIAARIHDSLTLHFTPGTNFMIGLTDILQKYLLKLEIIFKIKSVNLCHDEAGEGELKLVANLNKTYGDTHLIISNDADMILLTVASEIENIHIEYTPKTVISINKLINRINFDDNVGLNFMLQCLLFGNDYIPKLYYINYDNICAAYEEAVTCVPLSSNITIDFLINLFQTIVKYVPSHLKNKFIIGNDPYSYIDGLIWCFNMYKTSKCIRYDYINKSSSPNPFIILQFLNNKKLPNPIPKISNISNKLYSLLVMPKTNFTKFCTNDKFDSFRHKFYFLYDEEDCNICYEYYNLSVKDPVSINNMINHRKTHNKFVLSTIYKIIVWFDTGSDDLTCNSNLMDSSILL